MSTAKPERVEIATKANDAPVLNPVLLDQIRSLDESGGDELINKIMCAYLESADNYIHKLEDAMMNEDTDSISRLAHTLKSSSANIGAEKLSEIFKQIEVYGRAGELANVKALQKNLLQHYQQVLAEIRKILNQS